jgi:hypothetical protein
MRPGGCDIYGKVTILSKIVAPLRDFIRRVAMFDDGACEGSPNPLRPKNEIVCGWIRSTGAEARRRGKFAAKFLQFSTPWTGLSLATLQGFGKFVNRT